MMTPREIGLRPWLRVQIGPDAGVNGLSLSGNDFA
jgi:hypothetical protein